MNETASKPLFLYPFDLMVVKQSMIEEYHASMFKGDMDGEELFERYCFKKREMVSLNHIVRCFMSLEGTMQTVNISLSDGKGITAIVPHTEFLGIMEKYNNFVIPADIPKDEDDSIDVDGFEVDDEDFGLEDIENG